MTDSALADALTQAVARLDVDAKLSTWREVALEAGVLDVCIQALRIAELNPQVAYIGFDLVDSSLGADVVLNRRMLNSERAVLDQVEMWPTSTFTPDPESFEPLLTMIDQRPFLDLGKVRAFATARA